MRLRRLAWNQPNALSAFTAGRGAGRLNPQGTGVIYTSTSLPLAVLEVMAHWEEYFTSEGYGVCTADIAEGFPVETLPQGFPVSDKAQCREYGLAWYGQRRSAVLVVPSVLMPPAFDALLPSLQPHGAFTLDPLILNALQRPGDNRRRRP